ncbi:MAG: beta-galactosidase, partial [Pedobacter sp.]|nr:beta-galactosidase [Pedobacter sp.]
MRNPLALIAIALIALACNGRSFINPTQALPNFLRDTVKTNISNIPFKNYLEVNAFEWDFVAPNSPDKIDDSKFDVIKCFGGIRHYLDWVRIEPQKGKYTFSVTHEGGYDYDLIYTRMKEAGLNVLVDLKTCPKWLVDTYPKD